MKKSLLIILFVICITHSVPSFAGNSDILTKIENDLYGFDYTKDTVQNRVSRLEKTIYGKISSGDYNMRINCKQNEIYPTF